MSKISVVKQPLVSKAASNGWRSRISGRLPVRHGGPALWVAASLVLSVGTLLGVLWRFDALGLWLGPYLHLTDRLASAAAVGFLVLPLLVWMTEDVSQAALKARRLWDAGMVATAVWLGTSVARLLSQHNQAGGSFSLSALFRHLAESWEAQLLVLQACLLVGAVLGAVVGDFSRQLQDRSQPRILVVGMVLAALAAGALAPAENLPGSTRFLLVVHVLAAVLWAAPLVALTLLAAQLKQDLAELRRVTENFSQLALVAAVTVLVTGGAMALAGLDGPWPSLLRGIGLLLVVKAGALSVLLGIGAVQRRNLKGLSAEGRRAGSATPFICWAVLELMLMAVTFALSVGATEMVNMVVAGR